MRKIARQGYAIDNEEFMEGMVAIAVPVFDHRGRFHASLAFHGPVMRLTIDGMIEKKHILLNASEKLTEAIFEVS